jgi:hypothetical protein
VGGGGGDGAASLRMVARERQMKRKKGFTCALTRYIPFTHCPLFVSYGHLVGQLLTSQTPHGVLPRPGPIFHNPHASTARSSSYSPNKS